MPQLFIDADYNTPTTFKLFKVENTVPYTPKRDDNITTVITNIPQDLMIEIQHFLYNSNEINIRILKYNDIKFRDYVYIDPNIARFVIEKSSNFCCPLANRVHRHNTSYFNYNYQTHTLKYGCFNEDCKD